MLLPVAIEKRNFELVQEFVASDAKPDTALPFPDIILQTAGNNQAAAFITDGNQTA